MESNISIKTKRIAKNSLMLYIRLFFLLIIGLYTSRIILEALGVVDFGIYNLVGGIIFITNFISNSLALSVERFLTYELGLNNKKKLCHTFSMAVNINVIIAAVIILFGEAVGPYLIEFKLNIPADKITDAHIVFQTSLISFILMILGTPYNSSIISHERMDIFAFVSILQGITKLAIAIGINYCDSEKLPIFAVLMIIPSLFFYTFNYIFTRKYKETTYHFYWSKKLFGKMSLFAGYSAFGNMATAIVTQGQNILLNIFFGPALNAVRGLATQINGALTSFLNGIYTATNPQIIKSYAQQNLGYFHALIINSTKLGYVLSFMISLPIFLEADIILRLWLGTVPPYTMSFVRLILINSIIYNFVTPTWMAIQATGNVAKTQITTGLLNLANLPLTYLIWKSNTTLSPNYMYIINIIISFAMQVATLYIQKKIIKISLYFYTKKVIVPLLYGSIVAAIIPVLCHKLVNTGYIRLGLIFLSSVICCSLSFYFLSLEKNIRCHINRWIKDKISKQNGIKQ